MSVEPHGVQRVGRTHCTRGRLLGHRASVGTIVVHNEAERELHGVLLMCTDVRSIAGLTARQVCRGALLMLVLVVNARRSARGCRLATGWYAVGHGRAVWPARAAAAIAAAAVRHGVWCLLLLLLVRLCQMRALWGLCACAGSALAAMRARRPALLSLSSSAEIRIQQNEDQKASRPFVSVNYVFGFTTEKPGGRERLYRISLCEVLMQSVSSACVAHFTTAW